MQNGGQEEGRKKVGRRKIEGRKKEDRRKVDSRYVQDTSKEAGRNMEAIQSVAQKFDGG